jgi:ABC-type phosphate transport system substrate-binding protein
MVREKARRLFALMVAGSLVLTACTRPSGQSGAAAAPNGSGGLSGRLSVAGSTALEPLMAQAAADFRAANPNVQIQVVEPAGGSHAGRKISNWSDVGGDNQRVVPINRVAGSGTRQTLANFLFQGDATRFAVADSEEESQQVVRAVSQTPGGISYQGSAFLNGANLVPLGIQDGNTVLTLNKGTVQSGAWPIGGPGLAITKGPATPLEAAFLNYLIGQSFEADPVWDSLGYVAPSSPAVGKPAAN